jgi:hypothetical protein
MPPLLHYFDRPEQAAQDKLLGLCIQQGYVPAGCLLGGDMVLGLIGKGQDPCRGCHGPRHICLGRDFQAASGAAAERLGLGTAVTGERGGLVRAFFLGGDCAPAESHRSDDGSLVVGMAWPRDPAMTWENLSDNEADWWFAYVWARTLTSVERASARQWAALIHQLHQAFGFEKIVLDPGGGGIFVQRELKSAKQFINGVEREVTPIVDQVNGPREVTRGYFILHMYKRGDPGIELLWPKLADDALLNDASYSEMKQAVDTTGVLFPPLLAELKLEQPDLLRSWSPDRLKALEALNKMVDQFKGLLVTKVDGPEGPVFAFTKRGARTFEATGKKDLLSGGMYSYLGFRMWLRAGDWKNQVRPANRAMFSGA